MPRAREASVRQHQKSFTAQSSTNLAQLSTIFVLKKKQNGGAGKQIVFQNFCPNFHFFQKSFAAQFSTNLAQFSTTFVFLKKRNGGANFLDITYPRNMDQIRAGAPRPCLSCYGL